GRRVVGTPLATPRGMFLLVNRNTGEPIAEHVTYEDALSTRDAIAIQVGCDLDIVDTETTKPVDSWPTLDGAA
ncbi:hypothetical protein, partial [Enterococcus casseliflavus]|uniref:hypothetical protein n=1 Tax=Enterococcus casseliflavus TaxID=37734 RepID=UPI003D0A516A